MAKTVEELLVYQLAERIDGRVWALREGIRAESPGLWDQLDRSVGSIADNIAEGFGRETRADFRNFLRFSRGSAFEAKSQLRRAQRRGFLDGSDAEGLQVDLRDLSVRLKNFQDYLKRSARSTNSYEAREPNASYLAADQIDWAEELPDWWLLSNPEQA